MSLRIIVSLSIATSVATLPTFAVADSCWWHNGSLMRLGAVEENRYFSYEILRDDLAPTGARENMVMFDGVHANGNYSGTARVFSASCPAEPLRYAVAGHVTQDPLTITLHGLRPVRENCVPTGALVEDELVFTYAHQC